MEDHRIGVSMDVEKLTEERIATEDELREIKRTIDAIDRKLGRCERRHGRLARKLVRVQFEQRRGQQSRWLSRRLRRLERKRQALLNHEMELRWQYSSIARRRTILRQNLKRVNNQLYGASR